MPHDNIIRVGNSVLQHGTENDRVYLMKLDESDILKVIEVIDNLVNRNGYSKIFAKIPEKSSEFFTGRGFSIEASVPMMVNGVSSGYFMGKYFNSTRKTVSNQKLLDEVLKVAETKSVEVGIQPDTSSVKRLGPEHCSKLAELYDNVFESYPFPITNPEFILEEMNSDVYFYGIFAGKKLVAASSAEMDSSWKCVEMTDFATLPEARGNGAAGNLLARMNKDMSDMGILTAFTIARAGSFGMNAVFAKDGYSLAGTLPNNTQIGGRLESMNVWYKAIASS
ncbi:putative beta-lysine N-acetyltransferase [Maridesulfovibrio bastinii]|uniref:putative beta-lysine N-acetyltransferase n=1 Tax=Maridesulfovibrio bastinii TaxID=47157 RepID=UPI0004179A21|nr:putative beta-lysine N-acetyltransferase [Maridesulfovibrio bastinii]